MTTAAAKTVLIACLAHRLGGTLIQDLFGKDYHFKPAADDKSDKPIHVCAIPFEDAAAIHRLLRIKEAYALVDPDAELPPVPAAPVNTQTMAGDQGASTPGKKPLIIKAADGTEINLTDMPVEEMRAFAKENFGITCHHKWAKETIATKIMEKLRAEDEA